MIRNTVSKSISNRKQAFRLALLLAVTGSAGLATEDSGLLAQAPQVTSTELPVYPFAPVAPVTVDAGAKKAMVRILGFKGSKVTPHSSATSISPIDAKAASEFIGLPSLPNAIDSNLTNQPLAQLPQFVADSPVVAANATRPIQGVQASLSDSMEVESQDASDLVNSLADMVSPSKSASPETLAHASDFTDSINIEIPSDAEESVEDSGISMNMSDRDSRPSNSQSKAPELLNTKRNKSLKAETTDQLSEGVPRHSGIGLPAMTAVPATAFPSDGQPAQSFQPSQTTGNMPVPVPFAEPMNAFEPPAVAVQLAASSRKEQKPGALNIRVEGEPGLTAVPSRPPLVPMLATATSRGKMPELNAIQSHPQQSMPKSMPVPMGNSTPTQAKEVSVNVKDSIALQSVEAIQGLSVEHEGVCQVIQTGTKSFSLIGLRPGETRVAVITETDGKRNVQIQQVRVGMAQSTGQDSSSIASEMSQTIQQLYPRSKVRITTRGNELVVGGKVDSEDTAKKILSFVRKTTLTPVVDELQTH